jgi:pimeloyl-ACP methyl ester carboxylesterase
MTAGPLTTNASDPAVLAQKHAYARVNDILIHYVVSGSAPGPAVVLLHGWTSTWYQWSANVMPALARHYTVIAPDMRGVGDSDKPAEEAGYEKKNMAEDIHQLVRHLGHKDIYLVGHDFGATVAYAYAVAHRDDVKKLVILDMPFPGFGYEEGLRFDPPRKDPLGREFWHLAWHDAPSEIFEALVTGRERTYLRYFFQQFSYDPSAVSEADLDEYTRHYASPGGLRSVNYYRTHAVDAEYFRESSKTPLEMPVLALGGDHFNGITVKDAMEQMATDVRGGVIPDCGHWVTDEQPQYVIDQLLAFFKEE